MYQGFHTALFSGYSCVPTARESLVMADRAKHCGVDLCRREVVCHRSVLVCTRVNRPRVLGLEETVGMALEHCEGVGCPFIHRLTNMLVYVTGAGLSGRQVHRTQAVFNHTEDYILLPDERTISLCCWDSRTAERRNLLSLGHNNIVRCIVHSPTNPGFMTCSDDFRARFWYRRSTTD